MARGFRKSRGKYVAGLDDEERWVLVSLLEQTAALLESAGLEGAAGGVATMPPDERGSVAGSADSADGAAETEAPSGSADAQFEQLMRSAGWGEESVGGQFGGGMPAPAAIDEEALRADPAIGRLLPDGHHDDPLAAAEFRRFSADGVRLGKISRLHGAIEALRPDGAPLRLAEPEAVAVLVGLTDVRLVLAERLGLRTEEDAAELERAIEAGEAADAAPLILTYDFLTWLQETLASALSA